MADVRRLLVVDDNPAIHEDFKKVLIAGKSEARDEVADLEAKIFGTERKVAPDAGITWRIDSAFGGQEALELVRKAEGERDPYSLLFVDVRMPPGWDGLETVQNIWRTYPDKEIVICTAYSDYSMEDIISKLGISEQLLFLKKPFDAAEILQMALALSTKWELAKKARAHVRDLEEKVSARTAELNQLLRDMKEANLALDASLNSLRETQEKLVYSSRMSAIGEMAAGIAHEINNPLSIIYLFSEELQQIIASGEQSKEVLLARTQKIKSTTMRVAKIVAALRTLSRSDGGKEPFLLVEVGAIVGDSLELCRERFKNGGVDLRVGALPTDFKVECRSFQISQILLNLLNNAFDAIQPLAEKWVKIEVEHSDETVKILVTDSGPGISEEAIANLFKPFFTTKPAGKGTGLGLSISKAIAEEHQGSLSVERGCAHTCFVITLPLKRRN